ncbi:MAG: heme-binding protein [Halieaceae bacterium]
MSIRFASFHPVAFVIAFIIVIESVDVAATEEPRFELIDRWPDKNIELREYDARILAVTRMDTAENGGFSTLAGYIFGGNTAEQKIAMTAPVQTSMAGSAVQEMAFVMPSQFGESDLPEPNDPAIDLRPMSGYVAAVIAFSGRASASTAETHWKQLREFLEESNLEAVGPPTLNQYNPPWTLPFLRRNEIIVPINRDSLPETKT